MSDTMADLRVQVATIRSYIGEIGNLPDQVEKFCGIVAGSLRTQYAGPGVLNVFSVERAIDRLYEDRDKLNRAIQEAWEKLNELDPDLEIPVELLRISNEWRNFKGLVQAAREDYLTTDLSDRWTGDAAYSYDKVRKRQEAALNSVRDTSEDIAKSLQVVAESQLALYVDLATKSRELVTEVTSLVGSYTSIIVAPWDISNAADKTTDMAVAVENMKTLIVGVVSAMTTSSATTMAENNFIAQSYSIIDGLPYNKWPAAVSEAHPGGLRDVIGDSTTKDGDKSDWSPGATVVVAP